MTNFAYFYTNPLLETASDPVIGEWEVERIYRDLGDRTALKQLLNDCKTHPPDRLLLRRLEEIGDTVTEISDCLQCLEALGIEIIVTEQSYHRSQLNEARMIEEIARNQRNLRLREGHSKNRLKALPPPGKAPYGYRRGKERYILDRSTAPVVKDFFDRFLLLGSLRGAVKYLEKRYGKKISVSTGRKWLTNPVYRGDLAYLSQDIIPDTHASILSRSEAAQIDRLLRSNSKLPNRSASAPHSLAGLVVCQPCQSGMTITRVTTRETAREYLYLRPLQCARQPKCSAIAYSQVLECTLESICQDLPQAIEQLSLPDLDGIKRAIEGKITEKRDILKQLPSLQTEGILDEETANLRAYKLNTEIAQLQGQLDRLPPGNLRIIAREVAFPQFWQDLSEFERRFYFREFIRRVEIIRDAEKGWKIQLVFVF